VTLSRLLCSFAALTALVGCSTLNDLSQETYYRVHVTDPRGKLIADWVADGHVKRIEGGYRFRAVERISGPPWPKHIRYPHGRVVEASGPNIVVTRCPKPLWLSSTYREETVVLDYSGK
jgi:hypothetical protein